MEQPKRKLLDVMRLHGIDAKKPVQSQMEEEPVPIPQKNVKKVVPQRQKKSKWEYEIPELDLEHLYARIDDLIKLKNAPPPKVTKTQASNGSSRKIKMSESWIRYKERAFAKCGSRRDEEAMNKLLEVEYKTAIQSDTMKRDWDNHPLPLLQSERLANATLQMKPKQNDWAAATELNSHLSAQNQRNTKHSTAQNTNLHSAAGNSQLPNRFAQKANVNQTQPNNSNIPRRPVVSAGHNGMLSNPGAIKGFIDPNGKPQLVTADPDAENKLFALAKIEGTCQDIEKPYYRLTEVPHPSEVRPEPILKKALAHILAKFSRGECDVHWVTDQFRSIRLDMKIQRIHNAFTVQVYEQNSLFCLAHDYIDQFNQCLLQLYLLYRDNISGNRQEFMMYKMVYMVMGKDKFGLDKMLKEQDSEDLESEFTDIVLQLKQDIHQGNFVKIFRTMREHRIEAVRRIMMLFKVKLRVWALTILCKSYKPSVTLEYIQTVMNFEDRQTCVEFLTSIGCVLNLEKGILQLKESKQPVCDSKLIENGFV